MSAGEDTNGKSILLYALLELSAFNSFNKLTKVLFKSLLNGSDQQLLADFKPLNGQLVAKLLPQLEPKVRHMSDWLQIIVLCQHFDEEIGQSLDLVANYSPTGNDDKYDKCIQWSFTRLNLLIASMAMTCRVDNQFLMTDTSHSFRPKFVDIYYKLKSLKVLSFLAMGLPIELLSVIINETFLWTQPTQLDVYVMQKHSQLISAYTNIVKDINAYHTFMRQDFLFALNECLDFIVTHLHSFCDYLIKCLNKTQIHLVVDNWDTDLMNNFMVAFPQSNHFIDLLTKSATNLSVLSDEDFLLQLVNQMSK